MNYRTNKEYKLEVNRFRQLYYFCLQYHDMKARIDAMIGLKAVSNDGQPHSTLTGDPTMLQAIKIERLQSKVNLIERTAEDAGKEIAKGLLVGVTTKDATYDYLAKKGYLFCGRDLYYQRRRIFYWLLDQRLEANDE